MKHILRIFFMVVFAVAIFFFMLYVEIDQILSERIVPGANLTLEAWIDTFRQWASIGIGGSLIAALIWYFIAQWIFKVIRWKDAGKRPVWYLLFLVPILISVLSCVFTSQTQEAVLFAYFFYFVNNLLAFYLGTVLFSPSSFMYTPLGATTLRHLKLAI